MVSCYRFQSTGKPVLRDHLFEKQKRFKQVVVSTGLTAKLSMLKGQLPPPPTGRHLKQVLLSIVTHSGEDTGPINLKVGFIDRKVLEIERDRYRIYLRQHSGGSGKDFEVVALWPGTDQSQQCHLAGNKSKFKKQIFWKC